MASPSKRREQDVMKLWVQQFVALGGHTHAFARSSDGTICCAPVSVCSMMSDWKVELVDDNISEFHVEFQGPKDSKCPLLLQP